MAAFIAFLGGVGVGVVGTIFQPPLVIVAAVAAGLTAMWKGSKASGDCGPPRSAYLLGAGALSMTLAFLTLVLPVLV